MKHRRWRGSLVGPALIGLGIVFLLNNLGWLSWNVWDVLFRLWPIILIGIGLDILLGRRWAWGRGWSRLLCWACCSSPWGC